MTDTAAGPGHGGGKPARTRSADAGRPALGARWRRGAHRRQRLVPLLLVLPAALFFTCFLVAPLAKLLLLSFYRFDRRRGIVETLSLQNHLRFWSDEFYWSVLYTTFSVSVAVTIITLVLGYVVALYIQRASPRARAIVILAVLSPLLVSVVVRSFGWLMIIGPSGLINNVTTALGIGTFDIMFTKAAVIIGLAHVLLPLTTLAILASLQTIDPALVPAAVGLGASRWQAFKRVTLPLSLPGILGGSAITFSLASASFVTPALLGGPQVKVLAFVAYQQNVVLLDWPFGAAMAMALMLIVFAVIALKSRAVERGRFAAVFR